MKPNVEEALRYLGAGSEAPPELRRQAEIASERLAGLVQPRYVYRVFDLTRRGNAFLVPGADLLLEGELARQMLAECSRVAVLACTLGAACDALLRAERARDLAFSVVLDSCANALVEQGCDAAEEELRARFPGWYLTDRFSPGYGDLPLTLQPRLCAALDTERRLGICLEEGLLMTPVKSVTAFLGLSDQPQPARIRGCEHCMKKESCGLGRGGKHCER